MSTPVAVNASVAAGPPAHLLRRWPWRAVADGILTLAVAAVTVVLLSHLGPGASTTPTHIPGGRQVLAAVVTAAPILLWRRQPLLMFTAVAGCATAFAAAGEIVWLPVGPAAALYLLTASRNENTPWPPVSIATVIGLVTAYLVVAGTAAGIDVSELIHAAVAFAAAWFAGERTRLHHAHVAGLRARADAAERDAARERDLAVAEERNRIARDLHDSAAHALNVIAVRAGAARLRHDPDRDLGALVAIEELARQTMNDIDQFVGSLRNTSGRVEVPPGMAALDTLVAHHAESGHHLQVTRTGRPQALAVAVDHGAYRIVQEAATNAARYGDGRTLVCVEYDEDMLDLRITNGLRRRTVSAPGGGHGLIGMRERATSLDGELTAGMVGDQFVVHARLPYEGRRP